MTPSPNEPLARVSDIRRVKSNTEKYSYSVQPIGYFFTMYKDGSPIYDSKEYDSYSEAEVIAESMAAAYTLDDGI